jgi:gliding motility associated protien GldN
MKKFAVILIAGTGLFLAVHTGLKAQDLTTGSIYEKENVPYRKPVPLPHLREADIVWSKMLWRMVDLRQKMNHALYFPTAPFGPRMSLIDVLYKAIENGEIQAYQDEQFQTTIDLATIQNNLGSESRTETVVDVGTGQSITRQIAGEVRTYEVMEYLILEQWYFDKQHSRFGSRIIGFAPIRIYQRRDEQGNETEERLKRQVFWVYFPHIREVLARHEAFTTNNDLSNLSFDDLFLQRRFAGYIYRESNVYDNRAIMDYAMGRDAQYESERIHNAIFDFEQDLWEY